MSDEDRIPQVVAGCRVLYFTRIDQRHTPTHACRHVVGGDELTDVWGLAICLRKDHASYYLFRCDEGYMPLTETWHPTLADAFHQAEFEYQGITSTWQQAPPN